MKVYVVSDIHGDIELLIEEVINNLDLSKNKLIINGDFVCGGCWGTKGGLVLDFLEKYDKLFKSGNIIWLEGNHEYDNPIRYGIKDVMDEYMDSAIGYKLNTPNGISLITHVGVNQDGLIIAPENWDSYTPSLLENEHLWVDKTRFYEVVVGHIWTSHYALAQAWGKRQIKKWIKPKYLHLPFGEIDYHHLTASFRNNNPIRKSANKKLVMIDTKTYATRKINVYEIDNVLSMVKVNPDEIEVY